MAIQELAFVFEGRDRVSETTERIRGKMEGLNEGIGRLGKTAAFALGVTAVGAVAGFGFEMVKGVRSAEKYQTMLLVTAQTLKTTGAAAWESVDKVKALAEHISELTGIQDETVISGENLLLTFRNVKNQVGANNDVFNRATQVATDMSVALHKDLNPVIKSVGMALNDPISGMGKLSKLGITFTKQQKEQIKQWVEHGHVLTAQKFILAQLESRYKGVAAAAGGGLQGALNRLHNAWEDSIRDLSLALLPALTKVVVWFADRIPTAIGTFKSVMGGIGTFLNATVIPIFEGIGSKVTAGLAKVNWGAFLGKFQQLGKSVARGAAFWAGWILNALKGGFNTGNWNPLGHALSVGFSRAVAAITGLAKSLTATISGWIRSVDWKSVRKTVADKISNVFGGITAAASGLARAVDGWVKGIDWKTTGKNLANTLVDAVSTAIPVVGKGGGALLGAVKAWIDSVDWAQAGSDSVHIAVPFALGFISNLQDGIIDYAGHHPLDVIQFALVFVPLGKFAAAFKPLRSVIEHLPLGKSFTWLLDHTAVPVFDGIRALVRRMGSKFAEGFAEIFPNLSKKMSGFWKGIDTEIRGRALYAADDAKKFVEGLAQGAGRGVGSLVKQIGRIISDLVTPFKPAGQWLIARGLQLVRGLLTGVANMTAPLRNAIAKKIGELTAPFRPAIGWLTRRGSEFIRGLLNGIVNMTHSVSATIFQKIGELTNPFRNAFGWLKASGANLIRGLLTGIRDELSGISSWVNNNIVGPITQAVRDHFGIKSPSTVFHAIGGHLIGGLVRGMLHANPVKFITRIFHGMPQALAALVQKGLVSIGNLPSAAMNALMSVGGAIAGLGNITVPKNVTGNLAIGRSILAQMGFADSQWPALYSLWQGESGWNQFALNASSGAYGIPQSLPASKMASAGADWKTNPATQIIWGLNYIRSAYGTPANAYAKWLSRSPHWYDSGGIARGRGFLLKNTLQPERVLSPRQTAMFERVLSRGGFNGWGGNGDVHIHLNAPNYVGSRRELLDVLHQEARRGALRQLVRNAGRL